jgi:hypothetical protein
LEVSGCSADHENNLRICNCSHKGDEMQINREKINMGQVDSGEQCEPWASCLFIDFVINFFFLCFGL